MKLNVKIKFFSTLILLLQYKTVVYSGLVPVLEPESFYYSSSTINHELKDIDVSSGSLSTNLGQHNNVDSCPFLDALLLENDVVDFLDKLISLIKKNGPTSKNVADFIKNKKLQLPNTRNGILNSPGSSVGTSNNILSNHSPVDGFSKPSNKLSIEVTGDDVFSITGTPSLDNKLSLSVNGVDNFNFKPSGNPTGNHINKIPNSFSPHHINPQQQSFPYDRNYDGLSIPNGIGDQPFKKSPSHVISLEVTGNDNINFAGSPSSDKTLSLSLSGVNNFSVQPTTPTFSQSEALSQPSVSSINGVHQPFPKENLFDHLTLDDFPDNIKPRDVSDSVNNFKNIDNQFFSDSPPKKTISVEVTGSDNLSMVGSPSPDSSSLSVSLSGVDSFKVLPSAVLPSAHNEHNIDTSTFLPHDSNNPSHANKIENVDRNTGRPVFGNFNDQPSSSYSSGNVLSPQDIAHHNVNNFGSPSYDSSLPLSLTVVDNLDGLQSPESSSSALPSPSHNMFNNFIADDELPHGISNPTSEHNPLHYDGSIHNDTSQNFFNEFPLHDINSPDLIHGDNMRLSELPTADDNLPLSLTVFDNFDGLQQSPRPSISTSTSPLYHDEYNNAAANDGSPYNINNPTDEIKRQLSSFNYMDKPEFDDYSHSEENHLLHHPLQELKSKPIRLSVDVTGSEVLSLTGSPSPDHDNIMLSVAGVNNFNVSPSYSNFDRNGKNLPQSIGDESLFKQKPSSSIHPDHADSVLDNQSFGNAPSQKSLSFEVIGSKNLNLTGSPSFDNTVFISLTDVDNFIIKPSSNPLKTSIKSSDSSFGGSFPTNPSLLPSGSSSEALPSTTLDSSSRPYDSSYNDVYPGTSSSSSPENFSGSSVPSFNDGSLSATFDSPYGPSTSFYNGGFPETISSMPLDTVPSQSSRTFNGDFPISSSFLPDDYSLQTPPSTYNEFQKLHEDMNSNNLPKEFISHSSRFDGYNQPINEGYKHPLLDNTFQNLNSVNQQKPNKLSIEISGNELLSLAGSPVFHNDKLSLLVNGVENFNVIPKSNLFAPTNTPDIGSIAINNPGDTIPQKISSKDYEAPFNNNVYDVPFRSSPGQKILSLEVTGNDDLNVVGSPLPDKTLSLSLNGVDNFKYLQPPATPLSPLVLSQHAPNSLFNEFNTALPNDDTSFHTSQEILNRPLHSDESFSENYGHPLVDHLSQTLNSVNEKKPNKLLVEIIGSDLLSIAGVPSFDNNMLILSVIGVDNFNVIPSPDANNPIGQTGIESGYPINFGDRPLQNKKLFPSANVNEPLDKSAVDGGLPSYAKNTMSQDVFSKDFVEPFNDNFDNAPFRKSPIRKILLLQVIGNNDINVVGSSLADNILSLSLKGVDNFSVFPSPPSLSPLALSWFHPLGSSYDKNSPALSSDSSPFHHSNEVFHEPLPSNRNYEPLFNDNLYSQPLLRHPLGTVSIEQQQHPYWVGIGISGSDQLHITGSPFVYKNEVSLSVTGVDDFNISPLFDGRIPNGKLSTDSVSPFNFRHVKRKPKQPHYNQDYSKSDINYQPFDQHRPNNIVSIDVNGNDDWIIIGTPSFDKTLSLSLIGFKNFNVLPIATLPLLLSNDFTKINGLPTNDGNLVLHDRFRSLPSNSSDELLLNDYNNGQLPHDTLNNGQSPIGTNINDQLPFDNNLQSYVNNFNGGLSPIDNFNNGQSPFDIVNNGQMPFDNFNNEHPILSHLNSGQSPFDNYSNGQLPFNNNDHGQLPFDINRNSPSPFINNGNGQSPFNNNGNGQPPFDNFNNNISPVLTNSDLWQPLNTFSIKVSGSETLNVARTKPSNSDKVGLSITGVDDFDVISFSSPCGSSVVGFDVPQIQSNEINSQFVQSPLYPSKLSHENNNRYHTKVLTPADIFRRKLLKRRTRLPKFGQPAVNGIGEHSFHNPGMIGSKFRMNTLSIEVTGDELMSLTGIQSFEPGHKLSLSVIGIDNFSISPSTMSSFEHFGSSQPDDSGFTVYENITSSNFDDHYPDYMDAKPFPRNKKKVYKIVTTDTTTTTITETLDGKLSFLITGLDEFGIVSQSVLPENVFQPNDNFNSQDYNEFRPDTRNNYNSTTDYFNNPMFDQPLSPELQPKKNKLTVELFGIDNLNIISSQTNPEKLSLSIGLVDRFEVTPILSSSGSPDDIDYVTKQKDIYNTHTSHNEFTNTEYSTFSNGNQKDLGSIPSDNEKLLNDEDYYQKILTDTDVTSRKRRHSELFDQSSGDNLDNKVFNDNYLTQSQPVVSDSEFDKNNNVEANWKDKQFHSGLDDTSAAPDLLTHKDDDVYRFVTTDTETTKRKRHNIHSTTDYFDTTNELHGTSGEELKADYSSGDNIFGVPSAVNRTDFTETKSDHELGTNPLESKPSGTSDAKDSGGVSLALTVIETITITRTVTDHKISLTIYGIEGFDVINSSVVKPESELNKDNNMKEKHEIITEHHTGTENMLPSYEVSKPTFGDDSFLQNDVSHGFADSTGKQNNQLEGAEDSLSYMITSTDTLVNKRKRSRSSFDLFDSSESVGNEHSPLDKQNDLNQFSITDNEHHSVTNFIDTYHQPNNSLHVDKASSESPQHDNSSVMKEKTHHTEVYNEVKFIESLQHHHALKPSLSITNLNNLNIAGSVLTNTKGISFNIVGSDTKAVFKPDEYDKDKVTLMISGIDELGIESVTETSKSTDTPGLAISGITDLDLTPILPPAPEVAEVTSESVQQSEEMTPSTPTTLDTVNKENVNGEYTFVITETETIRRKRHRIRADGTIGSEEEEEEEELPPLDTNDVNNELESIDTQVATDDTMETPMNTHDHQVIGNDLDNREREGLPTETDESFMMVLDETTTHRRKNSRTHVLTHELNPYDESPSTIDYIPDVNSEIDTTDHHHHDEHVLQYDDTPAVSEDIQLSSDESGVSTTDYESSETGNSNEFSGSDSSKKSKKKKLKKKKKKNSDEERSYIITTTVTTVRRKKKPKPDGSNSSSGSPQMPHQKPPVVPRRLPPPPYGSAFMPPLMPFRPPLSATPPIRVPDPRRLPVAPRLPVLRKRLAPSA